MATKHTIDGYKAAQPQWISVKDRLPKLHQEVIVAIFFQYSDLSPGRHVVLAALVPDSKGAVWSIHKYDGWVVEIHYWMPLPEPPEEEK
jgi:hypothetical protein